MRRSFSVIPFCILLFSCGSNEERNTATPPGTIVDRQEREVLAVAPVAFPELFAQLEEQDTSFLAEGFGDFSAAAPLDTAGSTPGRLEEVSKFQRFFIFNSDSSRAIDPYSYSYLLVERGGKERLVPGGPDTEVGMVDLVTKERRRLLYFGPSYLLLDASWKGRDTVMLAITEAISDSEISPEIWEVDLASMTRRVSRYPDTLKVNMEAYRAQKLDSTKY